MTTAAPPRTVAVLGPRDSAVRPLAETLTAALGSGFPGDGAGRVRVVVDAGPDDRPDVAVLVVDAVCPIRPDDVEVARGVAARVPMVVALAGRTATCTPDALAENRGVTARRLADAGVDAPVLVVDETSPAAVTTLLRALEGLEPRRPGPGDGVGGAVTPTPTAAGSTAATASASASAPASASATATVDWLLARRTEALTSRSQSLRQDVQSLRIDLTRDLHRALRELGGRAREDIGAAPRGRIDGIVRDLSDTADSAVADVVGRADARVAGLVTRHLGTGAPAVPSMPTPTVDDRPTRVPRHRGEEFLVLVMGAAGGTGVGRMILTPLADVPALAAALVPLALLAGLALGWTTVEVRRTQTLRTHMIAVVSDRLAGLRAEAEQTLGARVLTAEATVTDGFAHDPGPRVADLERRIRRLRSSARPSVPPAAASSLPGSDPR